MKIFLACLFSFVFTSMIAQNNSDSLYKEKYRPQFHFSPAKNWTNDPNGLVCHNGVYHLFFQYNPFGNEWGHMSWGHASSKDLIHWKNLPVAIPEEKNFMIFKKSLEVMPKVKKSQVNCSILNLSHSLLLWSSKRFSRCIRNFRFRI